MHVNPSTASIDTTTLAHASDTSELPFSGIRKTTFELPPVPESSNMLAPLQGTSDEHKVGAKIFRNAELVFQLSTAMRFTDETLIQILEASKTSKPASQLASQLAS